MKPHKHAEIIRAWADGAKIESTYHLGVMPWADNPKPLWLEDYLYRVKPAEPERLYPLTKMMLEDFDAVLMNSCAKQGLALHVAGAIANTALRHACDAGQIVTREEFDRAIGDRKKRDWKIANTVDEAWRTKVLHLLPQVDHMSIARMVNIPLVLDGIKQ